MTTPKFCIISQKSYNPNITEILVFLLSLRLIDFPNLLQKDLSFEKFGHVINLLAPRAFFGHFGNMGLIIVNLTMA